MPGNAVTSLSLLFLRIGNWVHGPVKQITQGLAVKPMPRQDWGIPESAKCLPKCSFCTFSENSETPSTEGVNQGGEGSEDIFFIRWFHGMCFADGLDPELTRVEGLDWPEGFSPAREGLRVLLGIAPFPAWGKAGVPWKWKSAAGWFWGVPLLVVCYRLEQLFWDDFFMTSKQSGRPPSLACSDTAGLLFSLFNILK